MLSQPYLEDGLERVLQPWEQHPRQLWSWFEMLHFSAKAFFLCGNLLQAIRSDCLLGAAECLNGEPVFAMPRDLDKKARDKALRSLAMVETEFRGIGMVITADTVKEIGEELNSPIVRRSFQWLHDQSKAVERLANKEFKGKLFLYIPAERAKFWPTMDQPNAFGDAAAKSFPSAAFDIHNAAICVATTQSTAAVFHLMRVLEIGLTALGKEFGVSLEHTNWAPAIEQIESKIRDMHKDPAWKALPDCKGRQEFYAQAASHFGILKDAWRNYTMHARGKYTEDESERIFENVKGFMQQLAERLHE
jgi:hypothetical protein